MAKTLVYQMYPRAWNGLREMTNHLRRIAELGADYVWLTPLYPSLGFEGGYDIINHQAIDSRFGTMADFDHFVRTAHALGIGVLMDLVLSETSVAHPWFKEKSGYYCWSDTDRPKWHNLFDDGPAWEKYRSDNPDEKAERSYYLHIGHESTADLNWFPGKTLNHPLVFEFRRIVRFWLEEHGVDGFHLYLPQCLNKNLDAESLELSDLFWRDDMVSIVDAVFSGASLMTKSNQQPFLIADFLDPTPTDILNRYSRWLPEINFFLNPLVKTAIMKDDGLAVLEECVNVSAKNQRFMLNLESPGSARFTSVSNLLAPQILDLMFDSGAEGICLYQGQELGTTNPIWAQLNDRDIISLDAMALVRFEKGESMGGIRRTSSANARTRISLTDYACQEGQRGSTLEYTKSKIKAWKSAP